MRLGRISSSRLTQNSSICSVTTRGYVGRRYSRHNPKSNSLTTTEKFISAWFLSVASGFMGGGVWGLYQGMKEPLTPSCGKDYSLWKAGLERTFSAFEGFTFGALLGTASGTLFHIPFIYQVYEENKNR